MTAITLTGTNRSYPISVTIVTPSNISTSASTSIITAGTVPTATSYTTVVDIEALIQNIAGNIGIKRGEKSTIKLPDGSVIQVDELGNYEILDENAKRVYLANNNLEFNRFLNASDIVSEFIEYVKPMGITKGEFLTLPLELFIKFIILEAARQDGDDVDPSINIPKQITHIKQHPRCGFCGRWIRRSHAAKGLLFCNSEHFQRKFQAIGV